MQSSLLFVLAHVCAVLDLAGSGAIVQTHFQFYENVSLHANMVSSAAYSKPDMLSGGRSCMYRCTD